MSSFNFAFAAKENVLVVFGQFNQNVERIQGLVELLLSDPHMLSYIVKQDAEHLLRTRFFL